ncbi:galectin-3-like [Discoglossus pictus]
MLRTSQDTAKSFPASIMQYPALVIVFLLAQMVASEEYPLPFSYKFEAGFVPHTKVTVLGSVAENPKRIIMNFAQDAKTIFLHFTPRFNKNTIILNSRRNDKWQTEVVIKGNPLKAGQDFKVDFEFEEDFANIFLNDKFLSKFKARLHPVTAIHYLEIYGSIILKSIVVTTM